MFCSNKINLSLTKEQFKTVKIHLLIGIFSLIIGSIYAILNYGTGNAVAAIEIGIWFVIAISLLDYLDIIQFRKTVEKLTKCAVCGKVSTNGGEFKSHSKEKIERSTKEGDETEIKKQYQREKDKPLEGVVIKDRVVCFECVEKIRKLKYD